MKRHISNAKSDLVGLHGLAAKTEASERGILERAEARLEEVTAMIERHLPGIEAAPESAQDRYSDLVQEAAQLRVVIAKARQVLGS